MRVFWRFKTSHHRLTYVVQNVIVAPRKPALVKRDRTMIENVVEGSPVLAKVTFVIIGFTPTFQIDFVVEGVTQGIDNKFVNANWQVINNTFPII